MSLVEQMCTRGAAAPSAQAEQRRRRCLSVVGCARAPDPGLHAARTGLIDAAVRCLPSQAFCIPTTAQPTSNDHASWGTITPKPNRLQNDIRERNRQLDTTHKEVTALKTQVSAKER
jgi:hypothetical protein